jgi:hypothetical protein
MGRRGKLGKGSVEKKSLIQNMLSLRFLRYTVVGYVQMALKLKDITKLQVTDLDIIAI